MPRHHPHLIRLNCLWFCLLFAAASWAASAEDRVYFATEFKIGEVTQNSAIIWTRLTAAPERNWDGVMPNPHESPTRVFVEEPDIPPEL